MSELSKTRINHLLNKSITKRELNVISLVCEGLTNDVISKNLNNIPHATVRGILHSVFKKLKISNRIKLIIYVHNIDHQQDIKDTTIEALLKLDNK